MMETMTRDTGLDGLVTLLREQQVRKIDMVVNAGALRSVEGQIQVKGLGPILDDDGVTDPNGLYVPTRVFDQGVSQRFDIPGQYLQRMRLARPDLYDANVNGWLHGRRAKMRPQTDAEKAVFGDQGPAEVRPGVPGDDRSFLMRTFRGDGDGPGLGRAFLSDRYSVVDHLDVLMSVLDAIRGLGVNIVVDQADLTETRMVVKIVAPEIQVLAETMLAGYRNPFSDDMDRWRPVADREGLGYGGDEPVVWAGLKISNSETGGGAFTIVPEMKVKVCRNGLTITKDAVRAIHLGGRLDAGVIRWSEDTQAKNIDLVKAKTADAVRTFLDVDYMTQTIAAIEADAVKKVKTDDVKVIAKRAKYSEAEQDAILDMFVRGGQMTRGGIMQAATAASQTFDDPDVAFEMENKALSLLTA